MGVFVDTFDNTSGTADVPITSWNNGAWSIVKGYSAIANEAIVRAGTRGLVFRGGAFALVPRNAPGSPDHYVEMDVVALPETADRPSMTARFSARTFAPSMVGYDYGVTVQYLTGASARTNLRLRAPPSATSSTLYVGTANESVVNRSYTVRIEVRGDAVKFSLNGNTVYEGAPDLSALDDSDKVALLSFNSDSGMAGGRDTISVTRFECGPLDQDQEIIAPFSGHAHLASLAELSVPGVVTADDTGSAAYASEAWASSGGILVPDSRAAHAHAAAAASLLRGANLAIAPARHAIAAPPAGIALGAQLLASSCAHAHAAGSPALTGTALAVLSAFNDTCATAARLSAPAVVSQLLLDRSVFSRRAFQGAFARIGDQEVFTRIE